MAKKETTVKGAKDKEKETDPVKAKLNALAQAMGNIEKNFGRGAIMKLGDEQIEDVEVIPSGSIGLNYALGVGGYPRGRIIEIYGPESSGKTTLAIHAIAEAQKAGGIAAIIDAEHAFDRFYAEKLGVDVNNLLMAQPDNGEQALEIAEQLIRSSAIDILVVDSVAALTPKSEIDGDMGDKNVGVQARLMSQAMRKLTATISRTNTCCIFINQLREKIGVMFGPSETTTGGNALKFYASVRIDIRPSTSIKDGDDILGEGISRSGEIIDLGVEYGIIQKSGSWFSYNGSKIAQGRDQAKRMIMDNPELASELEEKINEALRNAATSKPAKKSSSEKDQKKSSAKGSKAEEAEEIADIADIADGTLPGTDDLDLPDDFSIEEDI